MHGQRFADLFFNGMQWVQRSHGFLKNDGNLITSYSLQYSLIDSDDLFALNSD